jgi:hypothetical protein
MRAERGIVRQVYNGLCLGQIGIASPASPLQLFVLIARGVMPLN